MNNTITIDSARNIPIGELSELPIATLVSLQRDANDHLDKAKRLKDWLDSAISLKYQNKATQTREFQDKVTGTIHFNDGNFKVTSIIAKKVDWNQSKLKEAISQIKEHCDNPYEYVTIAYKLSEAKFNAWPEYIKKFFRPARILKTSKESFKIEEIKEVCHE